MADREDKPGETLVERLDQKLQQSRQPGLARTTVTIVLTAAAVIVGLLLLWQLRQLLIYLFLSLLLAAALEAPVSFMERHGFPRGLAIGAPFILLVILLGLFGWLVIPPLIRQLAQLIQDLPGLVSSAQTWLQGVIDSLGLGGSLSGLVGRLGGGVNLGFLFRVPMTVAEGLAGAAIVIVSSVLMVAERKHIRNWTMELMQRSDRAPVMDVMYASLGKLGGYVRAQLLVMAFVGVGNGIGMLIFGVPFAFPLAVLSFFLEAIPNFGPIIGGIPIVFLALLKSPTAALIMVAWVVGIQALEGYVLTPLVQHRVLRLSPLLVLLAVTAGVILYGVLGGIIAIPLVAIGHLVLNEILVPLRQRTLQQRKEM